MLRPFSSCFFLIPLVAGCAVIGNSTLGTPIAVYTPNNSIEVAPAPRQATYALYKYSAPDEANLTGQEQIRAQVQVSNGKPIGFEKGTTGELLAVAGERKIPLPEG